MPELGVSNAQLILAAKQTAYMVFVSLAAGTVLAMIMAFALVLTRSDSILPNRFIYGILNTIINTVRSVPFIILMVFIMPLTKIDGCWNKDWDNSCFGASCHLHCTLSHASF